MECDHDELWQGEGRAPRGTCLMSFPTAWQDHWAAMREGAGTQVLCTWVRVPWVVVETQRKAQSRQAAELLHICKASFPGRRGQQGTS